MEFSLGVIYEMSDGLGSGYYIVTFKINPLYTIAAHNEKAAIEAIYADESEEHYVEKTCCLTREI